MAEQYTEEMHTTAHSQTTMHIMVEQYAEEMHTIAHSQTTLHGSREEQCIMELLTTAHS